MISEGFNNMGMAAYNTKIYILALKALVIPGKPVIKMFKYQMLFLQFLVLYFLDL